MVRPAKLTYVIPGYNTAIEPDINPNLPSCCISLFFKVWNGSSRGDRVQRHVDQSGDTSCSRRSRCRIKTLPLSSTGFVNVHLAT